MWKAEFNKCGCLPFWNWLNFLMTSKTMCDSSGCFMPLCPPAGAHEHCQALCPVLVPDVYGFISGCSMVYSRGWWLVMKDDICSCTCLGPPTSQSCVVVPALSDLVTLPSASYISSWLWGQLRSPVKQHDFSSAFPCCVAHVEHPLPFAGHSELLSPKVPGQPRSCAGR